MDTASVLALYDQERRAGIDVPGMRRESTECTARGIDLAGHRSWVTLSRLPARPIEDVIQQEIDCFEALGHDFEWKVYEHDSPTDLKELLAARGFEIDETEAILALDMAGSREGLPGSALHDVTRITDPGQIADVVSVEEQVWGEDHAWLGRRLANDLNRVPQQLSVYVAYVNEVAACSGWSYFHPASQFGSLWGGATLPGFRRRGLYTALLAARIAEARQRGVRYLTIDARSMSRPIAEKHGFAMLTRATGCLRRSRRLSSAPS